MEGMSDTVHLERRLSPEECRQLCCDAQETLERGDLPLSRQLFESARKYDPFSWKPIQGLARVAIAEGRNEDAWALALAAFEARQDDPENAALLQEAAALADRESQARQILSQAARTHQGSAHLDAFRPSPGQGAHEAEELCRKGEDLLESELWREAMFPFLEALDHDSSSVRAWSGLGIAYWRQNFRQASLESFRKAVRQSPSNEDAVLNLSETLTRIGQDGDVLSELLSLGVPRELCAKALDEQTGWKA
jgi:tetratricopeptide (TPR) repeat protein